MKAQIVGELAREGDRVIGVVRFIDDAGKALGDFAFSESLPIMANMRDSAQLQDYLIKTSMPVLQAAKTEAQWARVQALAATLVIKVEATNLSSE